MSDTFTFAELFLDKPEKIKKTITVNIETPSLDIFVANLYPSNKLRELLGSCPKQDDHFIYTANYSLLNVKGIFICNMNPTPIIFLGMVNTTEDK